MSRLTDTFEEIQAKGIRIRNLPPTEDIDYYVMWYWKNECWDRTEIPISNFADAVIFQELKARESHIHYVTIWCRQRGEENSRMLRQIYAPHPTFGVDLDSESFETLINHENDRIATWEAGG